MSAFIDTTDYRVAIRTDILTRLTVGDTAIVDDAENMAIELMRGYLSARYDVAAIFAATGTARNPILVKYAVDIAIMYIYQAIAPDQVPEGRVMNYDAAEKWLRRVQKEEINPPDLPKVANGVNDYVLFGSNPKRSNHIE